MPANPNPKQSVTQPSLNTSQPTSIEEVEQIIWH